MYKRQAIYRDAAEIILDNADSTLFLGGRGKNAKEISDNLGRETIDSFNTSENRGTQVSHGLNYQKLGKELMTQDEIAVMDGGKCILQLRGVRPFLSDKYDKMCIRDRRAACCCISVQTACTVQMGNRWTASVRLGRIRSDRVRMTD